MSLPPVLLLGPGRCGSTLLQRILNTSDKLSIWGEHAGFLRGFASAWAGLMEQKPIHKRHWDLPPADHLVKGSLTDYGAPINWANPFTKEDIENHFRTLIEAMLTKGLDTSAVHWGFKEIRYTNDEPFMRMWHKLFPGTKIFFVVREPVPVMRSMLIDWWVRNDDNLSADHLDEATVKPFVMRAARLYNKRVGSLNEWHADPSINSHLLHFEDLESKHEEVIRGMFEFLELPLPENAFEPVGKKTSVSRTSPLVPKVMEIIEAAKPQIADLVKPVAEQAGYTF